MLFNLLIYLFALTGIFLLFELSFFIQWTHFYLGDFHFIANHLTIPAKAIPAIIAFVLIILAIHVFYTFFIWIATYWIGKQLKLSPKATEQLGLIMWIVGIITVLLWNQFYFPNSKFSLMLSLLLPERLSWVCLVAALLFWGVIALFFSFSLLRLLPKQSVKILFAGSLLSFSPLHDNHKTANPWQSPNVIIIGIDSLRPDFLGFYGASNHTPHLDRFLKKSIVFDQAMTPLARTYPAWVSLLTGQYPKNNGIRTNLQENPQLDLTHTLPQLLRDQGYQTVFATDEVRFSTIDQRFGFDETITPPIGLNDFLLGTLNDFPMSNLFINTRLGQWLFPFSYANRGVFTAYDPNAFVQRLNRALMIRQDKPYFLAIHLCLPHFPYFWGRQKAQDQSLQNYQAAVARVDQQFNDVMTLLSKKGLLTQSLVIVLSDHGEAIELPNDRLTRANLFVLGAQKEIPHFYPPSFEAEKIDESAGHGTDVLGWPQYHVLLAFHFYPLGGLSASRQSDLVSLLDIKPTILSYLKIHDTQMDGYSLWHYIQEGRGHRKATDFMIESDFSPEAIRTVHPDFSQVLFEGINYFQIDPSTLRVKVKPEMLQLILSSKQYADYYQNWVLALYPDANHQMIPILVNRETGEWTNDLTTSFAIHSPAEHMLSALEKFYKNLLPL